jgi:hypothetical protein
MRAEPDDLLQFFDGLAVALHIIEDLRSKKQYIEIRGTLVDIFIQSHVQVAEGAAVFSGGSGLLGLSQVIKVFVYEEEDIEKPGTQ